MNGGDYESWDLIDLIRVRVDTGNTHGVYERVMEWFHRNGDIYVPCWGRDPWEGSYATIVESHSSSNPLKPAYMIVGFTPDLVSKAAHFKLVFG